jgi:hypothetical protein
MKKGKGKYPANKKQNGGDSSKMGSMPFQLGDEKGRFVKDSRKMGSLCFQKGK